MFEVMSILKLFITDRRAVTALEYGLIAGAIGLVVVVGATSFGTALSTKFTAMGSSL